MILPSIDLYNGKAVQLRQGREPVIEREDVFELLEAFSLYGEVAVIDLNAAFREGSNRDLIVEMAKRAPIRVGGGIRDLETARDYLKAGVTRIIIGTAAQEPFLKKLPKDQIVIALDAWGDNWVTDGWKTKTSLSPQDVLAQLAERCGEFLYTQVEKEGMMQGIDQERFKRIAEQSPLPVTFAGGITNIEDITFIRDLGAKAQIGMAVYSGHLSLEDCLFAQLDFEKQHLIPTVVQDLDTGAVLMLAYSSQDSLRRSLEERKGVYFSRSRKALWEKGATSGNRQRLVQVETDCDGDTLVFQVHQQGPACHFNRYSCFPKTNPGFDLNALEAVLKDRFDKRPEGSYTTKLFQSAEFLNSKILEEAQELVEAQSFEEVRWEASDLIYFALTKAISCGVSLDDIRAELRSRHAG